MPPVHGGSPRLLSSNSRRWLCQAQTRPPGEDSEHSGMESGRREITATVTEARADSLKPICLLGEPVWVDESRGWGMAGTRVRALLPRRPYRSRACRSDGGITALPRDKPLLPQQGHSSPGARFFSWKRPVQLCCCYKTNPSCPNPRVAPPPPKSGQQHSRHLNKMQYVAEDGALPAPVCLGPVLIAVCGQGFQLGAQEVGVLIEIILL